MPHQREKTIDPRVCPARIPLRGTVAVVIVLLAFLGFLAPAGALDFTGRIDTRYLLQAGDNAFGNDIYNYHSLELSFFKDFTFSWYGGVIASLNDRVNTFSTGTATRPATTPCGTCRTPATRASTSTTPSTPRS